MFVRIVACQSLRMDLQAAMRAAELGEAMYMRAFFERASDDVKERLGLRTLDVGGGVVCVMAHDPTGGFWNRTIGLGISEPVTREVLDRATGFVRDNGGPLSVIQVAPGAAPEGWSDLLAEAGASASATWVKFAAHDLAPPVATTDLRLEVLGAEDGADFARVMCEGFGMPTESPLPDWFGEMPAWRDGYTAYGAFDGDRMVAAAAMLTDGDVASLCGAATLPEARGRGAQSALMARRLRDAARSGCRWVVTETGSETDENPNPSLHNMRRTGFTELYERRNWVWQP